MGTKRTRRLTRYWDRQSDHYDQKMDRADRLFFGDTRRWITDRAQQETLEVAIGTGLNIPWYRESVKLTGIEMSAKMLAQAKDRARATERQAELRVGDAQALDFDDESFDTVVCTFSLCAIPDDDASMREMARVLRTGGRLLLADHVAAESLWLRALQAGVEMVTVPVGGEHFRRRPSRHVPALGLEIVERERFRRGIVERLVARKR